MKIKLSIAGAIGVFFGVLSILLGVFWFFGEPYVGKFDYISQKQTNFPVDGAWNEVCGLIFIACGMYLIITSIWDKDRSNNKRL